MKEKNKIEEELNELSPFLSKFKKENSFQVPPNYFEQMQREVLAKTKQLEEGKQASNSWFEHLIDQFNQLLQPKFALALTGVAALAIFVFFRLSPNETPLQELNLAEISSEAMQNYLADNLDKIDDEMLLEMSDDLSENYFAPTMDYPEEEVEMILDDLINDIDDKALEDLL